MKKLMFVFAALLLNFSAFAQDVEMADALRSSGKIYVVGLAVYLFLLDKRLTKIEKQK
jgi:hypothetical protein